MILNNIDTLNELLLDAEDFFVELNLGVNACVPLGDDQLLLRRNNGGWGLWVAAHTGGALIAVRSASKKQRVLAAFALRDLHAAVLQAAEDERISIEDACDTVRGFLAGARTKVSP